MATRQHQKNAKKLRSNLKVNGDVIQQCMLNNLATTANIWIEPYIKPKHHVEYLEQ